MSDLPKGCAELPTTLLDEDSFRQTFESPMLNITKVPLDLVVDIWPYVRSIPERDLGGYSSPPGGLDEELVEVVYRDARAWFDHVAVPTSTANVFVVIVVDLRESRVHGHHLLDLNELYGVSAPPP